MNKSSRNKSGAKVVRMLLPSLDVGGGEMAFLQISDSLSQQGHTVVLHSLLDRGELRYQLSKKVTFKPLCFSYIKRLFPGVFFAFFSLAWIIKKKPNSVFISTLTGTNLLLLLVKFLTGAHVPVIVVEASTGANRPSKLITWFMRFLYPKANFIVSVSDDVHKDLAFRLGDRSNDLAMKVIPNPVDVENAQQKAGELQFSDVMGVDKRVNLLAVGRLTEAKGLELLINAFDKVNASSVAKLVIVGDGELGPSLKKLVSSLGLEKSIFFTGRVSNPYPYFDKADVFVLSSLWEGLPLVLLEAMAMKVPQIILTDCPGSMSGKLEGVEGVDVFSSGNLASLSQVLECVISRKTYTKSDYSQLLGTFELKNVVSKYEALISEL